LDYSQTALKVKSQKTIKLNQKRPRKYMAEKTGIRKISYKVGKNEFICPDSDNIKYVTIDFNNKNHVCLCIDSHGDISITCNSEKRIKVLGQEENEIVFKLTK
jgi:hypothetical protein